VYICWAAANCRHVCGAGDRDSSLSIAVRAWKPRRMLPRASRSLDRFSAFCHVCCRRGQPVTSHFRESTVPGPGCIAAGSVPDAAAGCWARQPSSGSRRGASPTTPRQKHPDREGRVLTKSIYRFNHPASGKCMWGRGMTKRGVDADRVHGWLELTL
jgi:hypothetical protein